MFFNAKLIAAETFFVALKGRDLTVSVFVSSSLSGVYLGGRVKTPRFCFFLSDDVEVGLYSAALRGKVG